MNDSLTTGSILDYLRKAIAMDLGIVVFNPNKNAVPLVEKRPAREEMLIPGKPKPKNPPKYVKVKKKNLKKNKNSWKKI